jgi:type IV pilus assembly protein PilO
VKKQIALTPVLALALLLVAAVGWFALVSPKQARGSELDDQIAELETKLTLVSRPTAPEEPPKVEIDVADLFKLAKAMPDRDDMPGILLELNSTALSTGVEFLSIQPGVPASRGDYYAMPITLTYAGNYYDLADFLFRLRNLVTVRDGVLDAGGRLYTLDAIEFKEGKKGFPHVEAVLTISAYSFGPSPEAAAAGEAGATTATTTTQTGTTTTSTTTTTASAPSTTTTAPSPQGPPADPTGDGNQAAGGTP